MKTVSLGELVTIKGGGTPNRSVPEYWGGKIPWASVKDFKSQEINSTLETITDQGVAGSATNIIPAGNIIVPTRIAVGKAAINTIATAINQDLKALVPNGKIELRYLLHALIAKADVLERQASGATVKGITLDTLRSLKILLPPLDEQKRIAAILDKADAIRRKRAESLKLLDDLLRAAFLDMFGDPIANPKGWPIQILSNACKKITDGTHDTPERTATGVKFITSKNVRPFNIDLSDLEYVSEEIHREIYKRCNPEYGDIMYTNIGVNLGTAVMSPFREEVSMKNVALLKIDYSKLKPRFLEHLLNSASMKREIIRIASMGGAQKFLSLSQIRSLQIPVPEISRQNKFERIANKVYAAKALHISHQDESEILFHSLIARAFKSELTDEFSKQSEGKKYAKS